MNSIPPWPIQFLEVFKTRSLWFLSRDCKVISQSEGTGRNVVIVVFWIHCKLCVATVCWALLCTMPVLCVCRELIGAWQMMSSAPSVTKRVFCASRHAQMSTSELVWAEDIRAEPEPQRIRMCDASSAFCILGKREPLSLSYERLTWSKHVSISCSKYLIVV